MPAAAAADLVDERPGNEPVPNEGDCADFCAGRTPKLSCSAWFSASGRQVEDDRWERG